jgi:Flp pilus assembly protein TadD
MHGITKAIAIPFHLLQRPTRSPESNWMILNAAGAVRLARADFGIVGGSTFNSWFDKARAATMADSVDINLEIEGYNPDAESQRPPGVNAALDRIKANGVQSQIDRLKQAKAAETSGNFTARYLTGADLVTRALIGTGRIDDAVTLSRAMTELFPEAPRAWMVHGVALAIGGDTRGAAREYAKAKELFRPPVVDPNEKFPQVDDNWYYLDLLARTLIEWGRPSVAVPFARAIVDMYGSTARAHATLGLALAQSGDAKGAAAAYRRAVEVDPNETRAIELLRRLSNAT